jgi:hypothetical protein
MGDLYSWVLLLCAPASGLVYFLVSSWIGDVFPFSKYAMYADSATRTHGAVPVFFADGKEARIDDYHRFVGIDTSRMYPRELQCSLEWRVNEMRRWFDNHAAEGGDAGTSDVEFGFRILKVDDRGQLDESLKITATGTAWPK